ncbi:MAG: hypothetical protein HXS44_08735 [Theionarchaea archaeon]|nr:hypothetical protein [Theionarchaea archaeon]
MAVRKNRIIPEFFDVPRFFGRIFARYVWFHGYNHHFWHKNFLVIEYRILGGGPKRMKLLM